MNELQLVQAYARTNKFRVSYNKEQGEYSFVVKYGKAASRVTFLLDKDLNVTDILFDVTEIYSTYFSKNFPSEEKMLDALMVKQVFVAKAKYNGKLYGAVIDLAKMRMKEVLCTPLIAMCAFYRGMDQSFDCKFWKDDGNSVTEQMKRSLPRGRTNKKKFVFLIVIGAIVTALGAILTGINKDLVAFIVVGAILLSLGIFLTVMQGISARKKDPLYEVRCGKIVEFTPDGSRLDDVEVAKEPVKQQPAPAPQPAPQPAPAPQPEPAPAPQPVPGPGGKRKFGPLPTVGGPGPAPAQQAPAKAPTDGNIFYTPEFHGFLLEAFNLMVANDVYFSLRHDERILSENQVNYLLHNVDRSSPQAFRDSILKAIPEAQAQPGRKQEYGGYKKVTTWELMKFVMLEFMNFGAVRFAYGMGGFYLNFFFDEREVITSRLSTTTPQLINSATFICSLIEAVRRYIHFDGTPAKPRDEIALKTLVGENLAIRNIQFPAAYDIDCKDENHEVNNFVSSIDWNKEYHGYIDGDDKVIYEQGVRDLEEAIERYTNR